ncbi:MAG: thiol protease/hemagglutinin PrtT [Tannerellaceae bacterium]|jgi:hypothetical protein|nr:thiol protease/hemagglutinin PrtT [Tannerellaceae bacterium]
MKIKTYTFILFLIVSNIFLVKAKQVDVAKAREIAMAFAANGGVLRSASVNLVYTAVLKVQPLQPSEEIPLFYIYNTGDNAGFVIVAADDVASPILGYAAEGSFSAHNMPENLSRWLSGYEKNISSAIAAGAVASEKRLLEWQAFSSANLLADSQLETVTLLPTAKWDQAEPFNELCPRDGRSRSLVGCVATSMGIAMKYYGWPEKASGHVSYTTKDKRIPVSVNFNTAYAWDDMLDAYTRSNNVNLYTSAQATAVSTLLFHCGAMVRMDYSAEASGATEWDAVNALVNTFGYDKSLHLAWRELYNFDEWDNALQAELTAGRLVLYGGLTEDGTEGHQFLLDGFARNRSTGKSYYHVNWGWSGTANGFYILDALNPAESMPGSGYSYNHDAVLGLKRAVEGSFIDNELFFYEYETYETTGLFVNSPIQKGEPFTLNFSFIADYGMRDFNGAIGFFIFDKAGNKKAMLDSIQYTIEAGIARSEEDLGPYVINDWVDGDNLQMYYKPDGHDWKKVRGQKNAELSLAFSTGTKKVNKNTVELIAAISGENIHVRTVKNEAIRSIKITDMGGRTIARFTYTTAESTINIHVGHLPSGVYILEADMGNEARSIKVVKR